MSDKQVKYVFKKFKFMLGARAIDWNRPFTVYLSPLLSETDRNSDDNTVVKITATIQYDKAYLDTSEDI